MFWTRSRARFLSLIAFISVPRESFVIGSCPIARFHRGIPLTRRDVQFWLPIASDMSVSPYFSCGWEKCVEVRDPFVRKINREIFRQSSAIARRSEKLIASFSRASIRKAGECYSN